ncbi:hypothetical protein CRUP_020735 [Coryphaenoides rupestris]|nr:hypothetical protein CRUP_020735 [Coryphaenoides rupestris]
MATSSSRLEEDCICPVCRDLYSNPVVLLCGHSFCNDCLRCWWEQSDSQTCPVCKEMFPVGQPPRNLALRNLSDTLKQEAARRSASPTTQLLCETHGESLKLYCVDHQTLICVICRDSKDHKKHDCVPINEAAAYSRVQAQQTEKKIKEDFQKLYQFLHAEEATRLDKLRAENYNAITQRAQCTVPDPKTPSGALIDEASHRGNLLYHVWQKMKSIIHSSKN